MNTRPDYLAHAVLLAGVILFAFPVWLVFAGSTQDSGAIMRGELSLVPDLSNLSVYTRVLTTSTMGSAPGRNPAPPTLPDAGRTLPDGSTVNELNDGTSPLAPGVNCVLTNPAAPLSLVVPLLFPSKPLPVAS